MEYVCDESDGNKMRVMLLVRQDEKEKNPAK